MNLLAFVPSTVESDTTTSHSEPPAGTFIISTHTITSLPSIVGDIDCRDTVAPERKRWAIFVQCMGARSGREERNKYVDQV